MSQGHEPATQPAIHPSLLSGAQVLGLFALMGVLPGPRDALGLPLSRKATRAAKRAQKEANWRDRR